MKIIATTPTGYLVEATGTELANVAGYCSVSDVPGASRPGSYSYEHTLYVGMTIRPTETFKYLQRLRENEAKVKSSESMLRALADMLAGALPTTVIPPLSEDEGNQP